MLKDFNERQKIINRLQSLKQVWSIEGSCEKSNNVTSINSKIELVNTFSEDNKLKITKSHSVLHPLRIS